MSVSIRQLFRGFYKLCECDCGTLISIINTKGKFAKFAYRHNFINKSLNPAKKREKNKFNNPSWKFRRIKDNNYWRLNIPDYFSADRKGKVYEHVYFYQEYYQCCLLPWGVVHHIIPVSKGYCNNMPWNLMGMTKDAHMRLHYSNRPLKLDSLDRRCSDPECPNKGVNKHMKKTKKGILRPCWILDGKGGFFCHICYMRRYKRRKKLLINAPSQTSVSQQQQYRH